MPTLLSNPVNLGQLTDVTKIGLVNWHRGAEIGMKKALAARSLYFEKHASELNEEHSGFNESGTSHVTGDDENYALVSDTQGDTITLSQVKRTVRRRITEDLIEFNKYPRIGSLLRQTGSKLWRGYGLDLSHKFTFAFSTNYIDRDGRVVSLIGGDGAAMVANTHTLNNGNTIDNLITARLSESSAEDAVDLGNQMVDHNGEIVVPEFSVVVTGPHSNTRHTAMKLTSQQKQVGTDLNDMNPFSGQMRHVVLPYLPTTGTGAYDTTKDRYWFLMDESLAKGDEQLIASVRTMPSPERPTIDPDNNTVQFKGKMRYDIGHLDAHFIVGSNAT